MEVVLRNYRQLFLVWIAFTLSACSFTVSNEQITQGSWKVCDGLPSIGDGFNGQSLHLVDDTIYRQEKPYAKIINRVYEPTVTTGSWFRLTIRNIENKQVGMCCNK